MGTLDNPQLTAIVLHHHERLDGSGYPSGLKGRAIPLGSHMIAVADTFDAITSQRPYKRPPGLVLPSIAVSEDWVKRRGGGA